MSEAELRQRNRKDLEDQLQDEDNAKIIQKVHDDDEELDVNAYTTKKTMSQGLFDFTLFTRNATLLKHLIDQGSDQSSYFYFLVPLITIALIVQGTSGVLQLIMAKWNFNQKGGKTTLNKLNNVSVILVFITSALNVIINIFAIPDSKPNKLD
eukprot:01520.XXX_2544_3106_1 [CDS] Oithona nana genome sequencing.